MKDMIRTDKWPLQVSPEQHQMMLNTVAEYRRFCRALAIIILNQWPHLAQQDNFAAAVERLIHPTQINPSPRHRYFAKRFYKFPSYLRRAAIEFCRGQVSSYLTRYERWRSGIRQRRTARPPVFNPDAGCYPALYRGQLIKFDEHLAVASIKLWDGKEWLWHEVPVQRKRKRHLLGQMKSPSLVVGSRRCHLSMPFQIKPDRLPTGKVVAAFDLGMNTLATGSLISRDGTVAGRVFLNPAADIDRRNRQADLIRQKARKTAKLSRGFCKGHYRKARHINEHIAQIISRQMVDWALLHQVSVIVLENLKGWRPRGGKKGSSLKQRFHHWLHRRLADLVRDKFREAGGRVEFVYPRGTSAWAYDGSGKVSRDKDQYELATFKTGKIYNADLSASYNIGARYWAWKLKLTHRKDGQLPDDKNSPRKPRIPVTLSTLWHNSPRCGEGSPLSCAA